MENVSTLVCLGKFLCVPYQYITLYDDFSFNRDKHKSLCIVTYSRLET